VTEKRHANGKVAAGDLTQRVGVETMLMLRRLVRAA
jgi:hypothetical protein